MKRLRLSKTMTVSQFDCGYWYAVELKRFAKSIGIPSASRLRKDQLEPAIKAYLRTGSVGASRPGKRSSGITDDERGLRPGLPVVEYSNSTETKDFLEREARKRFPGHRRRSGARYRLNRWRENQVRKGTAITYGDLVDEYVRLCRPETAYARAPIRCYIYFLSDFLAGEPAATHAEAVRAWKQVKTLPVPKDYRSWKGSQSSRSRH